MRVVKVIFSLFCCASLPACSESPPHGRWEATTSVKVYAERNMGDIAFTVTKGDICAIGDKWHADKEQGYKKIICPQGRGWVANTELFKKIGD